MSQNNNTGGAVAEISGGHELSSSLSSVRRIWVPCFHCSRVNVCVQYRDAISSRSLLQLWCYNCLGFNPHWGFLITRFANYGWNTDDDDSESSDLRFSVENHNRVAAAAAGGSDDQPREFAYHNWNMDDQLLWEDWINSQLSEYENSSGRTEEEEEEEDEEEVDSSGWNDYREEIIWHYLITRDYRKCENNEDEEEGEICVICLIEFQRSDVFKRLDCGHDYHDECISEWLLHKNSCPVCIRTVIPSDFESEFNYYFSYD